MPKISVIVPVYNTEKYLHRCIDSILAQTFTDFELLLIDDGSKDSSGKICDEYAAKDSRVRVFHKENGGVSSARNLGLDNAQGEWIAFVDSDDQTLPNLLETYMDLRERDKQTDLCICGMTPDYSMSADYKIYNTTVDYNGNIKEALISLSGCQMIGSLCNKLFRRHIIEHNTLRLNENFKFREDEDFLLRYMCHVQRVASTSENCYIYFIPDFKKKYSGIDNFPVSLSMYSSILQIFDNEVNNITKLYLTDLVCSFFESFKNNNVNHWTRTKSVKMLVGREILYFDDLSRFSRLLLYYFPSNFATSVFKIKVKFLN